MSTSQRAVDQVRSILGKLDRDIDAARQKRLQGRLPQVPLPVLTPLAAVSPAGATPNAGLARPLARPAVAASVFGRATPMRMENRMPAPPI